MPECPEFRTGEERARNTLFARMNGGGTVANSSVGASG